MAATVMGNDIKYTIRQYHDNPYEDIDAGNSFTWYAVRDDGWQFFTRTDNEFQSLGCCGPKRPLFRQDPSNAARPRLAPSCLIIKPRAHTFLPTTALDLARVNLPPSVGRK
ncbi:hypothetical protein M433DRAFT_158366 [Acidomyces richmondensis BFW]|nr:MAG: hypothetical protein FE78DRAFT_86010 [Acidomyces sp. 'richmondensis']KYG42034.1 hypothetical protein M433DRAFT_158366 [Acidomyces richmondensis BFW]